MTPQPANLRLSLNTVWPPVPMCWQCLAVRVVEQGRVCPQCVILIANREVMLADQRSAIRALRHAAIIIGIVVVGLVIALAMQA